MSAIKGAEDYFPTSMNFVNQLVHNCQSEGRFIKPEDLRASAAIMLSLLIHSALFFSFREPPRQHFLPTEKPKQMALRVYSATAVTKTLVSATQSMPGSEAVTTSKQPTGPLRRKTAGQKKPVNRKSVVFGKPQSIPATVSEFVAAEKNPTQAAQHSNQRTVDNIIIEKANATLTSPTTAKPSAPTIIMNPRFRLPPDPPVYPRHSIRRSQEGTTLIRAKISRQGQVEILKIYQSSGFALLDQAAVAAVKKWEFEPARQNGLAVSSWVQVPVNFVLKKR